MKKIFFLIFALIIFSMTNNFVYSEETVEQLLASAKLKSSEKTEQNLYDAIKDYEKVLEIEPDNVSALNGKGAMLLLLNSVDESEIYIDRALEIEHDNVSALSNKAIILQSKGETELALKLFEKALEIEPNNTDTLFNQANLLKSIDVDKSLMILDRIIILDPENNNAIEQKDNLLNSLHEIRVDGYIQMALRDKNGSLIGYAESDHINIRNSTFVEFYLFQTASQVNKLSIGGEKFFNMIMNNTIPMNYDNTPSKSGLAITNVLTHASGEKVSYNPVWARTHGYMTEDGDFVETFLQMIIPQPEVAPQISN